jgi:hypothetical protein
MMRALRLEVFHARAEPSQSTVVTDLGAIEETRLAAFEKGYTAGWDDAGAAEAGDQTRIRADLARNIQALAFTFHDARSHVLKAIEPLIGDALCRLLPELARKALAPMIIEHLMPLARDMADAPVRLTLNPAARAPVEALLAETPGLPVTIIEEPSLAEGQAYLTLGVSELRLDMDQAIRAVTAAITDFFTLLKEDKAHGYAG